MQYGLDAESDVDDGIDPTLSNRAVPLVGRGGTPLAASSYSSYVSRRNSRAATLSREIISEEENASSQPISK